MSHDPKGKTVLVVEDQLDMRIFLRTLLETNGFRPVLAPDGNRGYDLARKERPDIIILDVMMPNEGGAIMYRNLKADPHLSQVPVIMLSAVAPKAFKHVLHMLDAAADFPLPPPEAYIEKPPTPQQVLQALQAFG